MTPTLVLIAIVLVPIIIMLLLRVNAALVFLSLCLGDVLVQFVAGDAADFLSLLSASPVAQSHAAATAHIQQTLQPAVHATMQPAVHAAGSNALRLILLLLPVVMTAVFMIRTVHGRGRLLLNALPAAGVGLLGALLVVPLLPPGLGHDITGSALWSEVQRAQDLIVGTSALVCLLVLWLQRPQTGSHKHGHSKHSKE